MSDTLFIFGHCPISFLLLVFMTGTMFVGKCYIRAFWLEPAPVPLYLLLVVLNL